MTPTVKQPRIYMGKNARNSIAARRLLLTGIGPAMASTSNAVDAASMSAGEVSRLHVRPATYPVMTAIVISTAMSQFPISWRMPVTRSQLATAVSGRSKAHTRTPNPIDPLRLLISKLRIAHASVRPASAANGSPVNARSQIDVIRNACAARNKSQPTAPAMMPLRAQAITSRVIRI